MNFEELKEIVNINSGTKNSKGVNKVGNYLLEKILEIDKFEIQRFSKNDDRVGDLIWIKSNKIDNKPNILFCGHIDTVFEETSSFQKFDEDDTTVYGPAVSDMKGGLIIMLNALRELKKEVGNIFNIDILLVPDEETGSQNYRQEMLEIYKNYKYGLVFEPTGEPNTLIDKRKGAYFVTVESFGKAGHSGYYSWDYTNAIDVMNKVIEDVSKLRNQEKDTSINFGFIKGGEKANIVADYAKLIFDIRAWDNSEFERVVNGLKKIEEKYDGKIKIKIDKLFSAFENKNSVKLRETILKVNKNIKFVSRKGGSDASGMSSAGIQTIDGFGSVGDNFHNNKEFAYKKYFEEKINLTKEVVIELLKKK